MQRKFFIDWNINSDDLIKNTEEYIKYSRKNNDTIKNINIDNIDKCYTLISILSDDITEYTTIISMFSILQYVSPLKNIRKSSYLAEYMLIEYKNEINMDYKLYNQIKKCYDFMKSHKISCDDIKFVSKVLKGYIKNGIQLSENNKKNFTRVKLEISKIENNINHYINNNNKVVGLTGEEISGLSDKIKDKLPIVSNNPVRYGIQLSKNNYANCMRYIKDNRTRKNIELCYNAKCYNIISDIARLQVLKDKYAKLSGYDNYFKLKISEYMFTDEQHIKDLLNDIVKKIDYRYVKEIDILNKLNNNNNINSWDLSFLVKNWKKEYGISEKYVKEFFLLKHTIHTIFDIYSELFGIKIKKSKNTHLWHNDVDMYTVFENNVPIGYFYLDLLNRNNKYTSTRCFPLKYGCIYPLKTGTKSIPTIALVASFAKNSSGYVLLNFNEVLSLFHEFAHIMHHIYGTNKYIIFSGMNVEKDFVETPAQIMEYICWEKDIIRKLSRHYVTNEQLPDNIIDKLIKIRDLNIGVQYKYHILISIYDQYINSSDKFINMCENIIVNKDNKYIKNKLSVEFACLYKQLYSNMMGSIYSPIDKYNIMFNEGIILPNIWIDSVISHNNLYYSNILSNITAADIYIKLRHNRKNLADKLKNYIFKVGGLKSSIYMVQDIMKNKVSLNGFMTLHGLECETNYSYFFNTSHFNNNTNNNTNNDDSYNDDSDSSGEEYTNRFSEVYIGSASPLQDEVNKLNFLKDKINSQISINNNYKSIFSRKN